MIRLILPLLAMIGLLLAPSGMIGGAAAAMPADRAETAAGHCDGMAPAAPAGEKLAVDCAIACAALPSITPAPLPQRSDTAAAPAPLRLTSPAGLAPEAETPPPRRS